VLLRVYSDCLKEHVSVFEIIRVLKSSLISVYMLHSTNPLWEEEPVCVMQADPAETLGDVTFY
jgi:hypothetical protein